jgi:hypothetical protein
MAIMLSFMKCPGCGFTWNKREDFLIDGRLEIIGYDADFEALQLGKLLFRHSCGMVIPMHVDAFKDLYSGPIYTERKTGTAECLGYCKRRDELKPCPVKCECAWVREVVHIIDKMKAIK